MLFFATTTFSQLAPPKQKINLNLTPAQSYENTRLKGPAMLLGGATFIAAGLLVPPVMEGGSTTQKKAPIHQLHRILPIVSGSAIIVVGFSFGIGG